MSNEGNTKKANQINGLNRQARKFLLQNCVSKRGAELMAFGFAGYLNGNEVENVTLIRKNSKWQLHGMDEIVFSIDGVFEFFATTENTI